MSAARLRSQLMFAGAVFGLLLAVRADGAGGVQVTLGSAGDGPRQRVRLRPVVGSIERVAIEGESASTVSISLLPDPGPKCGRSRTVFDLRTIAVAADGTVTAALEVIEADQTGGASGRGARSGLVGTTGILTMLPDGTITDVALTAADLDAAEIASIVGAARRMTTPFPTEPIGPGAIWTVRDVLDLGVVRVALITTCELVSIDGEEATIASTTTASPDETELTLADVGVKAKLTELIARGASTWTQPLTAIAPSARTAEGRYKVSVKGRKGLTPFKLRLETDAITRASAAPGP